MSIMDASFLWSDRKETPMHMEMVCVLKAPKVRDLEGYLDQVVDAMSSHIECVPCLNRRRTPGFFGWLFPRWIIENTLDPSQHITDVRVEGSGTQSDFEATVARLSQLPIDYRIKPFHLYVIRGLEDGRFALMYRLSHALTDGVNFIDLLFRSFSTSPEDMSGRPVWAAPPAVRPVVSAVAGSGNRFVETIKAMVRLFRAARDPHDPLAATFQCPRSTLNAPVDLSRGRRFQTLPLAQIKAIAKRTGTTVNDVIVTIVSGGLRGVLQRDQALPAKSLYACVPVSIRDRMPGEIEEAGNLITFGTCSLGTDIENDRDRLFHVQGSMQRNKEHLGQIPVPALIPYTVGVMAPYVVGNIMGLSKVMPPPFNLIVSNLKGPETDRFLCGSLVEAVFPVGIVSHGVSTNVTLMSYRGGVNIAFNFHPGCSEHFPEIDRHVLASLEALKVEPAARLAA